MICERCGGLVTWRGPLTNLTHTECECCGGRNCQIAEETADDAVFVHVSAQLDSCDHDFQGWREFDNGLGGEAVCAKCGLGAMTYSLRCGI